jgi:hypothetical protein
MLKIIIEGEELFDEKDQTFHSVGNFELELEHSLVSMSKWESLTQKPFLSKEEKTPTELKLYVEAMIISPNPPSNVVTMLSRDNMEAINAYISSSASATTFGDMPQTGKGKTEIITSELIYYWMVAFNIPFECERWHLNRLFSLIRICNLKNQKPKKMSRGELAARNRALNEERRKKLNTSG